MKIIKCSSIVFLLFCITSCLNLDSDKDKHNRVDIVYLDILDGVATADLEDDFLLSVVENSKKKFNMLSKSLAGFNYEYGYIYKLKVIKTTHYNIQDAPSPQYSYEVEKVLSKVLKTKENENTH